MTLQAIRTRLRSIAPAVLTLAIFAAMYRYGDWVFWVAMAASVLGVLLRLWTGTYIRIVRYPSTPE